MHIARNFFLGLTLILSSLLVADAQAESYNLIQRIKVKKEYVRNFQLALGNLLEQSRKEDGCLEFEFFQSVDNPSTFVVYGEWKTPKDWRIHSRTDHVKRFEASAKSYLSEPPETL